MKWRSNRVVPAILTYMNGAFWLCLRGGDAAAAKYPFLRIAERAPVRMAALFALGITLCWTLAAFGARGRKLWASALGGAAGFALLQGACWTLALGGIREFNFWGGVALDACGRGAVRADGVARTLLPL